MGIGIISDTLRKGVRNTEKDLKQATQTACSLPLLCMARPLIVHLEAVNRHRAPRNRNIVFSREWTSSVLEKHQGVELMKPYLGYIWRTDMKHNVVLGGTWATHPRMAGRKSSISRSGFLIWR